MMDVDERTQVDEGTVDKPTGATISYHSPAADDLLHGMLNGNTKGEMRGCHLEMISTCILF
jgi:hypothetical protein